MFSTTSSLQRSIFYLLNATTQVHVYYASERALRALVIWYVPAWVPNHCDTASLSRSTTRAKRRRINAVNRAVYLCMASTLCPSYIVYIHALIVDNRVKLKKSSRQLQQTQRSRSYTIDIALTYILHDSMKRMRRRWAAS